MDETQMLEVLEAGATARAALADRMAPLRGGEVAPWIRDEVAAGRCKVSEVRLGGKPVAAFWWWLSPGNKALVVNAAGSLVERDIFSVLIRGIEQVALSLGAQSIQFQTARAGLVAKTKAAGWIPEGIVMIKYL